MLGTKSEYISEYVVLNSVNLIPSDEAEHYSLRDITTDPFITVIIEYPLKNVIITF